MNEKEIEYIEYKKRWDNRISEIMSFGFTESQAIFLANEFNKLISI